MAHRLSARVEQAQAVKICHVNLARGFRGGERQTELLIRELSRQDVAQCAIVRRDEPLAARLGSIPGLELLPISRPFLTKARLGRGCLLHAHESKAAHFAHVCNLIAGSRYIITRRVDNSPSTSFLTRHMYRRAAATVAISSAIRDILKQYDPELEPRLIPSVQAQLVSNPETSAEIRQQWPERFIVGHVGALDNSQKGQLYIIRAARQLLESHPQIQFALLGDGKDDAWLKAEAADLPNLYFAGFVDNVGDWIAAFDLFILPSLHEGLGSVLLDAMSFSLPIVASRVDGIPEIVQEGENGLLVPPANDDALAEAICRLYKDAALRQRMGDRGRKIAEGYTPMSMAAAYQQLYQAVCTEGGLD